MYYPTTRVLTVLELLQSHPAMTGAEIARRLEVDIRTARRYIVMLEELGVPVTANRGRHGGYRLMPGFKLPPLMLNEDEAFALTLGLLVARQSGLAAHAPAVIGALAKVEGVLPEPVRDRVRAVEEAVVWDLGGQRGNEPNARVVLSLSTAAQQHRRVTMHHRKADGEETKRVFDPYGLVFRRDHWYVIGYCHLRGDQRLFRLDRLTAVTVELDIFERPEGFDVLAAVLRSLGSVPRQIAIEVVLDTTLSDARRHISAGVATLEEFAGGGVLLRGYTDNLDWIARMLSRMGCASSWTRWKFASLLIFVKPCAAMPRRSRSGPKGTQLERKP